MNLAFRHKYPFKGYLWETMFKEKILSCLKPNPLNHHRPKKHTFREDEKQRWKQGNLIHFCYYHRKPDQDNFHIGICTGVQKIHIIHELDSVLIFIDDKLFPQSRHLELAFNDGFDSLENFYEWFDRDWTGKIIHWTKLRY